MLPRQGAVHGRQRAGRRPCAPGVQDVGVVSVRWTEPKQARRGLLDSTSSQSVRVPRRCGAWAGACGVRARRPRAPGAQLVGRRQTEPKQARRGLPDKHKTTPFLADYRVSAHARPTSLDRSYVHGALSMFSVEAVLCLQGCHTLGKVTPTSKFKPANLQSRQTKYARASASQSRCSQPAYPLRRAPPECRPCALPALGPYRMHWGLCYSARVYRCLCYSTHSPNLTPAGLARRARAGSARPGGTRQRSSQAAHQSAWQTSL